MKCKRCGQEIEADALDGIVICGSCADDLRQEEEAEMMAIQAQDKAIAEQMNGEAYEDAMRENRLDRPR